MGSSMICVVWNLYPTHTKADKVGDDPSQGRTLEWTVASPSPEHTFEPMPVVKEMDPCWYAKVENRALETTTKTRAAPIAIDSILPFAMAMSLFVLVGGLTYQWYWIAILGGVTVLGLFVVRSLKDERKHYYGKEDPHE